MFSLQTDQWELTDILLFITEWRWFSWWVVPWSSCLRRFLRHYGKLQLKGQSCNLCVLWDFASMQEWTCCLMPWVKLATAEALMASTSSLLSQAPVALEGQHWCSLGRGDRGQEAAGCGGQQLSSSLRKGSESLEHSGHPPLLTCSLWLLLNVSRAHSRSRHYKFAFFILCLTWLDGKMHILKNSP